MEADVKPRSFEEIVRNEPLVLVDFSAEWCGPCKMMKPILEQVKATIGNRAKILKIDVDRNTRLASSFAITGVPTLILFKHGKVVWRQSGVVPPSTLATVIESNYK